MDESTFHTLAGDVLELISETLDAVAGDDVECDLQDGVLTIEIEGTGHYVINKHTPNRQIWVSSPVSGASHFSHRGAGGWVSTRGEETLLGLLSEEFSAALEQPITLA